MLVASLSTLIGESGWWKRLPPLSAQYISLIGQPSGVSESVAYNSEDRGFCTVHGKHFVLKISIPSSTSRYGRATRCRLERRPYPALSPVKVDRSSCIADPPRPLELRCARWGENKQPHCVGIAFQNHRRNVRKGLASRT